MADHHHHHHHQKSCCSSSFSHGCSFVNCHCHSHPPFPSVDPILLETLAAHRIYTRNRRFHGLRNPSERFHRPEEEEEEEDQRSANLLISSLVSRIETLEASLIQNPPTRRWRSLREVAARVIQTHFRAFLVRRSRTLGQLRELAIVKSSFASLRSSISDQTSFDLYGVARKAVDLLINLDSIQDDDYMVRDGKRTLSRDLVRFLDYVEGVSLKRRELYLKSRNTNARFGQNGDKRRVISNRNRRESDLDHRREIIGKLKERVEKIRGYTRVCRNDDEDVVLEGFQHVSENDDDDEDEDDYVKSTEEEENPVVVVAKKKSVSFAENRNVLKLFSDSNENDECDADCLDSGDSSTSSDDHRSQQDVEEVKSFSIDDGEENSNNVDKALCKRIGTSPMYEIRGRYEGKDGDFLFSAPMPVQMEEKSPTFRRREMK